MKPKSLRVHARARQEIDEAFEWYFQRHRGAAEAFLSEIARAMRQISARPSFTLHIQKTRAEES